MSLAKTLIRNAASNWLGYAVQVVVAFFLTPFVIKSLGQTRYGVWTLAMGLTGYYGLLDFGFSAGMTQYLTRYLAKKDFERLGITASTGIVALTACGLLVFLVSAAVALNAGRLFHTTPAMQREVALVILISGASIAVQFVLFTYSAVLTALQRFDLSTMIGIATRVLSAIATILALNAGYGLVGLSLVLAATNAVDYAIRWRVSARLLPLKVSPRSATFGAFKEITRFGLWNLLIAGGLRLITYTDALVIATFLPVSAVAPFALAGNLRSYFDDAFLRVGHVFFPAATHLDSSGDASGLEALYLVGSRLVLVMAVLAGALSVFWAGPFFRLWVGSAFADQVGLPYPPIAVIFAVLIVASTVTAGQRIGYQVLLGTRKMAVLAVLFISEGVANLILSVVFVRLYGVIGVAFGTLIPAVVVQGFCQPLVVCRELRIPLRRYAAHVLLRPTLLALILVPAMLSLRPLLTAVTWPEFFGLSVASSVVGGLAAVCVGLSGEERSRLISGPGAAFAAVLLNRRRA